MRYQTLTPHRPNTIRQARRVERVFKSFGLDFPDRGTDVEFVNRTPNTGIVYYSASGRIPKGLRDLAKLEGGCNLKGGEAYKFFLVQDVVELAERLSGRAGIIWRGNPTEFGDYVLPGEVFGVTDREGTTKPLLEIKGATRDGWVRVHAKFLGCTNFIAVPLTNDCYTIACGRSS